MVRTYAPPSGVVLSHKKSLVHIAVDTGIPIALLFEQGRQFAQKVQDLLQNEKLGLPMIMTSSVDQECKHLLDKVVDRLGELHRSFSTFLALKLRKTALNANDILKLQSHFGQEVVKAKKVIEKEEIRAFEFAIITKLREELEKRDEIPILELLKIVGQWTQNHYTDYQNKYDELKNKYWPVHEIRPHRKVLDFISRETGAKKNRDLIHITSTLLYSLTNDRWIIFCSLDYHHLVGKTTFERFLIYMTDPIYLPFSYQRLLKRCKGYPPRKYLLKSKKTAKAYKPLFSLLQQHHNLTIT